MCLVIMSRLLNTSHERTTPHCFPGCRSYAVTATAVETSRAVSSGDTKVKRKLEGYSNKGQHRKILILILCS